MTPSAFLGGQQGEQGQPTPQFGQQMPPGQQAAYGQQMPYGQMGPTGFPTIPYQKSKRSWGGRIFVTFILLIILGSVGVGVWAVMKGIDAAQKGTDLANPNLSGGDLDALDVSEDVTFLYEGEAAAAVAAALDAGIPGEPTQFTEISIYTDYAISTAQDPAVPGRFDQYIWRTGTVNPPTAMPDNPDAANVTFTIDEVNWNGHHRARCGLPASGRGRRWRGELHHRQPDRVHRGRADRRAHLRQRSSRECSGRGHRRRRVRQVLLTRSPHAH
jgi:hypothetical protein